MLINEAIGVQKVFVLQSEVDVVVVFATKSLAYQYAKDNKIHSYTIQEYPLIFGLPGRR